jgi:hypothetical protein
LKHIVAGGTEGDFIHLEYAGRRPPEPPVDRINPRREIHWRRRRTGRRSRGSGSQAWAKRTEEGQAPATIL